MNYFIEGLQGSGKSTLVKRLSEKYPDYRTVYEGEYSPVELAWCAYVDKKTYSKILDKYSEIRSEIEEKSFEEKGLNEKSLNEKGLDEKNLNEKNLNEKVLNEKDLWNNGAADDAHMIICYTKIITDISGFHKDLERYEIYNGRVDKDSFKDIILKRFRNWNGDKYIFECSIFQNIVEDMILFQKCSDEEIIDFYKSIKKTLLGKDYQILYLEADDIASNIDVIRKERSDDKGNEMWFPVMMQYFDNSPYALENKVEGPSALLEHLRHRQELELRICREVFDGNYRALKSKDYSL